MAEARRAVALVALLLLTAGLCGAQEPAEPATVTLRSGGISVELDRAHAWNIRQISFRGTPVVTPTGANGAIACIPVAGGWTGSAHTQGGAEQIEEVTLTVDGEFRDLADGATYTGGLMVLQKTSRLDKLRLRATLTLADGVLTQRHELTAVEDVLVTKTYPFMLCVTAQTKPWIAETVSGERQSGEFDDAGDLVWHDDWAWTATHIPDRDTGLIVRHLARPADAPTFTGYWDQERYHKLYVRWRQPELWPEGLTLSGEIALTGFIASDEDWREAARGVARELVAE